MKNENKINKHHKKQLNPEKIQPSFTAQHVIYNQGTDTYINKGTLIKQLTIAPNARQSFFNERKNLLSLLKREKNNPLVEEGDYTDSAARARTGEHYLTYEAMTVLIDTAIRNHKTKHLGLAYNSKNIFVIKNDIGLLEHILHNLDLISGEDAKIIFISGIHSIPFYIRNEQGKIRSFVVDSETDGSPNELINVISKVYPSADIISSSTKLQKDFYSCSTFAIKVLMYFVKHGDKVFPHIDQSRTKKIREGVEYVVLTEEQLMPALLKMSQTNINWSPEILNTIVSHKAQVTLGEYYKKYAINTGKKPLNSAALLKKYVYLEKLNQYLNKTIGTQEISTDNSTNLPRALKEQHERYEQPTLQRKIRQINPVDVYLEMVAILDNLKTIDMASKSTALQLQAIKNKFPTFIADYHKKFNAPRKTNPHTLNAQKLLFVAAYGEINDLDHLKLYDTFAIKLLELFTEYTDIVAYLKNHAQINTKQPIHDLCLFHIPDDRIENSWNKSYWGKLALQYGLAATKYFPLAPHIDKLLIQNPHQEESSQLSDLEHIKYLLESIPYTNAKKNKELAALCIDFYRSEEQFNHSLSIVEKGLKSFDLLPDITINGADLDPKLAKFTFKKLPISDLRGFFLGEYTSCCQSMHKQGTACALHGMTSPYSGFYVVYEHDKIVAQSWAWIGRKGTVVFDSWEYVNKSQAYMCKPFLLKAAQELVEFGFSEVFIGKGGNTPDLGFPTATPPIDFLIKDHYSDAKEQSIVQISSYSTKLERFSTYAKCTNLSYLNYAHLITEEMSDNVFATELTNLIAANNLPFEEFLNLIKFEYMNLHEVLHQKSEANHILLLTAFKTYGSQMQPLFLLRNSEGELALDVFIGFDDLRILEWIIEILGKQQAFALNTSQPFQFNSLTHSAVKSDAIAVLGYLYQQNKELNSWDELAALSNDNEYSVLFNAAKYHAQACINLMLSQMGDKNTLISLLYQEDGKTILHYLVEMNAVENFKRIEQICEQDKILQQLIVRGNSKSVLLTAFLANAQQLVIYLLVNWCDAKLQPLLNQDALGTAIITNNLNAVAFLRKLHHYEHQWLNSLLKAGDENPLLSALRRDYYPLAFYLIHSFFSFDNMHKLLTFRRIKQWGNDCLPLESINPKAPTEVINKLVRMILSLYDSEQELAIPLFMQENLSLFRAIIRSKNPVLFKDVIVYLSQEPLWFEQMYLDNGNNTFLNSIDFFLDECHEKEQLIPLSMRMEYLDALFSVCTMEQQKKLVATLDYQSLSPETLSYLLTKIDAIDKGAFRLTWASLESGNQGPLQKSFFSRHKHRGKITELLLQFYHQIYSAEYINKVLLEDWFHVSRYGNLPLLEHVYPAIRHDDEKLKELFFLGYGEIVGNISLETFAWLIDQKEIPDSLLIESLSIEARHKAFNSRIGYFDDLTFSSYLWQACVKRLTKDELLSIILTIYWDLHTKAVVNSNLFSNMLDRDKSHFKAIFLMLDSMIKFCHEHAKNPLILFTITNESGDTLFSISCDKPFSQIIKLILLNCTREERMQLLEDYKKKAVKDKTDIIQKVQEYITALSKLEILMALKADLIQQPQTKPSTAFFQNIPLEQQKLLSLLLPLSTNQLFYFDQQNNLEIISAETINEVWKQVSSVLNTHASLEENDALSSVFSIYKNYYEQMQDIPLVGQNKNLQM